MGDTAATATCPYCGATTDGLYDVRYQYCSRCREFYDRIGLCLHEDRETTPEYCEWWVTLGGYVVATEERRVEKMEALRAGLAEEDTLRHRVLSSEDDLKNAPWARRPWDQGVRSVEELLRWLEERGVSLAKFKTTRAFTRGCETVPWLRELDEQEQG